MRGGWLHNHLVRNLAERLLATGTTVQVERPINVGDTTLSADLVASSDDRILIVEVERTPDRIEGDLAKAAALGASVLAIVTPTSSVAKAVRRKLGRLPTTCQKTMIVVMPYVAAYQRLPDLLINKDDPVRGAASKSENRRGSGEKA